MKIGYIDKNIKYLISFYKLRDSFRNKKLRKLIQNFFVVSYFVN